MDEKNVVCLANKAFIAFKANDYPEASDFLHNFFGLLSSVRRSHGQCHRIKRVTELHYGSCWQFEAHSTLKSFFSEVVIR
jgi:hypothetical protein